MENTYTIKTLQRNTAQAVDDALAGGLVKITRHDEPVAAIISYERLSSIIETLELLANPAFMKTHRENKAGKLRHIALEDAKF